MRISEGGEEGRVGGGDMGLKISGGGDCCFSCGYCGYCFFTFFWWRGEGRMRG